MRSIQLGILTVAAVLVHGLWTEHHSLAATRYTEDLADLIRVAQSIVEVEVLDVQSKSVSGNPTQTIAQLKVVRTYKGEVIGSNMTVEYIGGFDAAQRTIAPGQPNLVAGHRFVLLVSHFPRTEHWSVAGGDAGQIELLVEDDVTVARRSSGQSFDFYKQDAKSLTGFVKMHRTALNQAEFANLLQTILTTGKPVVETGASLTPVSAPADRTANLDTTLSSREETSIPLTTRLLITVALTSLFWFFGSRVIAKRSKVL